MQAHTHTTHIQRERNRLIHMACMANMWTDIRMYVYNTETHETHSLHAPPPPSNPHVHTQSVVARWCHTHHLATPLVDQWNVPVHGTLTTLHGTHGSVKVGAPAVIVVVCGSLPQLSEEGSYDKEVRWCGMV